ncbi:MAG: hypothetical protein SYNGOMJ08_00168 [Candidatus Syntrophoarchaeum sp. GoM_oil]|nr:MAG: hypothetical protein SYNGOMJ08_00168 [Candidatus Syntrophoarchaeum sp. GoM_oil]
MEYGLAKLDDMNVLKIPPISEYGNVIEIADEFGGVPALKTALSTLQSLIYAT